jgi:hypothetical protein
MVVLEEWDDNHLPSKAFLVAMSNPTMTITSTAEASNYVRELTEDRWKGPPPYEGENDQETEYRPTLFPYDPRSCYKDDFRK